MTAEGQRVYTRRYKDKRISEGWCAHCFRTRKLETYRLCARCAESNRIRSGKRRGKIDEN